MNRKSLQRRLGTILAAGFLFVAGGASDRVWALENVKFVTQLDLFLPGDADEEPEDFSKAAAEGLAASGYSSANVETDTNSGVGVRIGLLKAVRGVELGGSLGYVLGPKVDSTVTGQSTLLVLGDGRIDREKTTQYVRLLGEVLKKWSINDAWALNLGAGAGVAHGSTKDDVTASGSVTSASGGSESDFGFTWEISPSISYKRLDVGVRYAGFPKIDGSSTVSDFKWSTFGFFVGASF